MAEYRLTPRAQDDVSGIWNWIAQRNTAAADALFFRLFARFRQAADFPLSGVRRKHLSDTARILLEGSYVIIYEPSEYGALIVAVVHGRREPESWLD